MIEACFISLIMAITGAELNMAVIAANGGMPVKEIPMAYDRWIALTETTKFPYLGDVLPFYLSIGDVLMFASIAIFLILVARNEVVRWQNSKS